MNKQRNLFGSMPLYGLTSDLSWATIAINSDQIVTIAIVPQ